MKSWNGLEQVFRFSMGIELGASALALLAALEFKKIIQNGAQVIHLSSEEWRASAGIFDRKAYDRAKTKLEDLGVVRIEREGRVLRITLWPNLIEEETNASEESVLTEEHKTKNELMPNLELERKAMETESQPEIEAEVQAEVQVEVQVEVQGIEEPIDRSGHKTLRGAFFGPTHRARYRTSDRSPDKTLDRTSDETSDRSPDKTLDRTSDETSDRTSDGTPHRTSDRTSHALGREANFMHYQAQTLGASGFRSVTRPPSFSHTSRYRLTLRRYSLTRYSLLRYPINSRIISLNLYKQRNNVNDVNNEQRKNVQRGNVNLRFNPLGLNRRKPVKEIGPEFHRLWQSEMGHALTSYEQEGLQRFLRMGCSQDLLLEALRHAVLADKRHMGYLLGILRNWHNEGVCHPQEILQARQSWEDQRFLQRKCEPV